MSLGLQYLQVFVAFLVGWGLGSRASEMIRQNVVNTAVVNADKMVQQNFVNTAVVNADFGSSYSNYTVNATNQIMFVYSYDVDYNVTTPVRVSVSSTSGTEDYPVMVVARQQETILSWQIPLDVGDRFHQVVSDSK